MDRNAHMIAGTGREDHASDKRQSPILLKHAI